MAVVTDEVKAVLVRELNLFRVDVLFSRGSDGPWIDRVIAIACAITKSFKLEEVKKNSGLPALSHGILLRWLCLVQQRWPHLPKTFGGHSASACTRR